MGNFWAMLEGIISKNLSILGSGLIDILLLQKGISSIWTYKATHVLKENLLEF